MHTDAFGRPLCVICGQLMSHAVRDGPEIVFSCANCGSEERCTIESAKVVPPDRQRSAAAA